MRHAKIRTNAPEVPRDATFASEGIVITDWTLTPIALDSGAEAILDEVADRRNHSDGCAALPPEILSQLHTRSDDEMHMALVHINARNNEYTCRVFVMRSPCERIDQPRVVLYLRREPSVSDAVRQLAADYHLTDREQEALIGISMGLTSKELAVRMNISPNTVKAFLRLIMIKMGATTRAGIVGKLLDQNGRPAANGAGERARSAGC